MKIEAGKLYKLRNGKKARAYATDAREALPVHGAYLENYGWVLCQWRLDGKIWSEDDTHDIVGPWEEPKPRRLAWIGTQSGRVYLLPENTSAQDPLDETSRAPWLDQPKEK